jgi:hypothetical protein
VLPPLLLAVLPLPLLPAPPLLPVPPPLPLLVLPPLLVNKSFLYI